MELRRVGTVMGERLAELAQERDLLQREIADLNRRIDALLTRARVAIDRQLAIEQELKRELLNARVPLPPRMDEDEELRAVAEVYRDNFDHAPRAAVASLFGYTPRTASRRIDRARERGYLPPTTQGRKRV